jgi:tRNA dimethylallyltransferase
VSGPALVAVVGPTAAGKTAAALALARRFGGELIGADSVQVHRGFDIGSGKASAEELGGIRHHLLDVLAPGERLDAAAFAALADAAIDDVVARGRRPIVVGGTPLWMRALLRGLVALPSVDPALRGALQARLAAEGAPALHAELAAIDPASAARIHPNDALRIGRALEIWQQTGERPSALRDAHARGAPRRPSWVAHVDLPGPEHDRAIEARIDAMLARGWLDETRALFEAFPDAAALGAVGYRELVRHLRGELSLEEARAQAIFATRRYAKQQRTWYRSEPGITVRTSAAALIAGAHDEALRTFLDAT